MQALGLKTSIRHCCWLSERFIIPDATFESCQHENRTATSYCSALKVLQHRFLEVVTHLKLAASQMLAIALVSFRQVELVRCDAQMVTRALLQFIIAMISSTIFREMDQIA